MKDLFKPRTIIAFTLYGTFCYLAVVGKISEQAVIAVVTSLMTFYYVERKKKSDKLSLNDSIKENKQ